VIGPTHFFDNIGKFLQVYQGLVVGMVSGDAKVPYVACRDIGKMALVAAQMGPPRLDEKRFLPVWTDFATGEELVAALAKVLGKGEHFDYSVHPEWLVRFFAPEVYMMRKGFERVGRPPVSLDPKTVEMMNETRALLKNDYWSLEQYLIEAGWDKKDLPPAPTPVWKKVLFGGAIVAAVGAIAYEVLKRM